MGYRNVASALAIVAMLTGCAMQEKQTLANLNQQPVNCGTAEGDIRVLQSEKVHVAQQVASGITAVAPAGIVLGILTGTEGTKMKVATGDYNKQIDDRVTLIRSTCRL